MMVTSEELLAGREMTFELEIPPSVMHPSLDGNGAAGQPVKKIQLRPLTVRDVQLIAKAAKDDEVLVSVLMIQKAVVNPPLSQGEILKLHSGLIGFLVSAINRISGLSSTDDELREMMDSPLVKAFFVLTKEFKWTPGQIKELTVGQILTYLEMLNQSKR